MITLPLFFERGLQGQSVSIRAIAHIYLSATTDLPLEEQEIDYLDTVRLSTHDTTLTYDDITLSYNPILRDLPTLSDKLDLINSEHIISSSKLSILNVETVTDINNTITESIFSDTVQNYLGKLVQIYYFVEGTNYLDDCLLMYTGVIKRYNQQADSVTLDLEDLSTIKYSVNIPNQLMPFDDSVREKDRGKPYPMPYGYIKYSPTRQFITEGHTGGYQLEGFALDNPDSSIGGVIESIDEYEHNVDLQSPYHIINYTYGTTPFSTTNSNEEYEKDFLYVYDKEYIHISKISLTQLGITQADGIPVDLYLDEGTKMYWYDNTTNSVRFTTDYFSEMGKLYETWLINESNEDTQENPNGYARIEFRPDELFTRIYRPIRKINFAVKRKSDSRANFYGVTNQQNDGYNWYPWANVNADSDFNTNSRTQFVTENTTDEQYELNWDYGNDNNWWRCQETYNSPSDTDLTYGSTDENWVTNNLSGPHSEVGEFPVNYVQDGNTSTGLYIEGKISDTGSYSHAFANMQIGESLSNLECETKIWTSISYWSDVTTQKFYKNAGGSVTNYMGPTGFTNVIKPRSKLADWIGAFEEQMGNTNRPPMKYLYHYLSESTAFDGPFPYGPYKDLPGDQLDDESNLEAMNPFYPFGYADDAGDHLYTGHFVDTRFDKMSVTKEYNFTLPSYFDNTFTDDANFFYHNVLLREFYMFHDLRISEPITRDFFVNVAGRVDVDGNVISNPHKILSDILEKEIGFVNHFENLSDIDDELSDWVMSFCIFEETPLNEFMNDMFKSSLTAVTFSTNGKLRLFTHKRYLNTEINISSSLINSLDVLTSKFSLSKNDDVSNQINVKYDWSEEDNRFKKETGYALQSTSGESYDTYDDFTNQYYPSNPYSLNYYNLYNAEGSKSFETKYIYDDNTAKKLQRKLLLWYTNQHLIMKISLPLKYLALEIGDYIEFDSLL